jgi:hypothetical protein
MTVQEILESLYAVARELDAAGFVAAGEDDLGRLHQGDGGCLSGFDVAVGVLRWGRGDLENQLNYGSTPYLQRG